ncbi:MAG TPA: GNAT family N-acetyltransferase [Rhizomicrobium sp.]|jgi:diamine N-acetyltransferase
MKPDFVIRPATQGDQSLILALLHELAVYEKLTDRFLITEAIINRDYLGTPARLECDLAFEGGKPAGIATWYWTYASFAARRGIYLEDLFVRPEYRGRGYGKILLANLAKRVSAGGGGHVDWAVLDWNKPSIDFYDSLGAKNNSGWLGYRLSGEALEALARDA